MTKTTSKAGATFNRWLVLIVAILALAADLGTKWWAQRALDDGVVYPIFGSYFSLELIHNPGAAFSMGTGSTWFFTVVSAAVLVFVIWYVASGRVQDRFVAVLIGFIAGGAAGNLYDRLVRPPGFGSGHVVDFLNYNNWFVGNVADIWIVVGVLVLVIYLFVTDAPGDKSD